MNRLPISQITNSLKKGTSTTATTNRSFTTTSNSFFNLNSRNINRLLQNNRNGVYQIDTNDESTLKMIPFTSFSTKRKATPFFNSTKGHTASSNNSNNSSSGSDYNLLGVPQPLKITVVPSSSKIFFYLVIGGAILYIIFVMKPGSLFSSMMSSKQTFKHLLSRPKERFSDVMGAEEAKGELQDLVEILRNPYKYYQNGVVMPKGILLVGPPGTGKTLLAKALAGEAGTHFLYINGSEFEEMFVGLGAKRVRELFEAARKNSPCIVFIDEIDSVGGARSKRVNYHPSDALNQLLVELDGFSGRDGVIVIAATNLAETLDPALTRSGRFDRTISVSLPDCNARKKILDLYLKNKKSTDNINTQIIAQATPGFSGADLFNLVNWAALEATKDNKPNITLEYLENAKENIVMGKPRHSVIMSDEARKICAYHEAGHALVAIMTPGAKPVHKATIMPRGDALGMVSMLLSDELFTTKKQYLADMDVAMGGRAAEELILGKDNISQGASSDIQAATKIAKAMVMYFGMSDKVGNIYIESEKKISTQQRELIDGEVKRIIDESYIRATELLKKYSKEHHLLAQALIEYETLSLEEIKDIIAKKSLKNKKKREQLVLERREKEKEKELLATTKPQTMPKIIFNTQTINTSNLNEDLEKQLHMKRQQEVQEMLKSLNNPRADDKIVPKSGDDSNNNQKSSITNVEVQVSKGHSIDIIVKSEHPHPNSNQKNDK
ncbi:hypothetical protein CYY_005799 [Polysphondylium violaceum]|uniref:AAA+ ATPase domain-containing protein n=1 Tax=Polysphondylium violaceum TaxID=133409 RepID=A0A8J4PUI4_9MYCE|nr:hypothetical protein CYY_005799 [Polysphondylium violaceum]